MPKITFHSALPVGLESEEEWCDVQLLSDLSPSNILERCAPLFPEGISMLGVTAIPLQNKTVPVKMRSYRIAFPKHMPDSPAQEHVKSLLEKFQNCTSLPFDMQRKKGIKTIDLKQVIQSLTISTGNSLLLNLNPAENSVPRVDEIIGEIFELSGDIRAGLKITKLRT